MYRKCSWFHKIRKLGFGGGDKDLYSNMFFGERGVWVICLRPTDVSKEKKKDFLKNVLNYVLMIISST